MRLLILPFLLALILSACSTTPSSSSTSSGMVRTPNCESKVRFSGLEVTFTGIEIPAIRTVTPGSPITLTYKLGSASFKNTQLQKAEDLTQALAVLESSSCDMFFGLSPDDSSRQIVLSNLRETRNLLVSTLTGLERASTTNDADKVLDDAKKTANDQAKQGASP